jgi:hypothetical protein
MIMKNNIKQLGFIYFALSFGIVAADAQGTFQNLDFESADVAGYGIGSSSVPISSALPGWSGFYGANQTSQVWYDGISLGGVIISVVDANAAQYGFGPLQGNYSVALFGQGLSSPMSTTISQTGMVPNGTISLRAMMAWSGAAPIVSLGGQIITMMPLQTFGSYTLYGGDISSFAGQVATLSFTEPPPIQSSPSSLLLDGIVFSAQAIPEPNVFGLLGAGGLLLALRGWRRNDK